MLTNEHLQNRINSCIEALNAMVSGQGFALTDPSVVQKSMELDELILCAMRKQRTSAKKPLQ